ncbi:adenylosuccinate lyase [Halobacteriovorax vibrionivorans]|uniref:Adenylosuccinate lyase n=1 Tax=Halobacteriovorax vibrionivorans TaxID=2152716 RepID=A0ABY0IH23_9BACT|nr:adenylosuccinate lyase [Halobacteriovorax vibrionivorans]RZF22243.1 adenylosuccinate lyase [Halobacteriovorax vibrionivorans]
MIERYNKAEISEIWTDQFKFEKFLEVEKALVVALEEAGLIENKFSNKLNTVSVSPERIKEIEKETRHDVIAFCTSITEQLETNEGKFFHYGVTSSDVIDTALTLQIKETLERTFPIFEKLLKSLEDKSLEYQDTICIGRSHGIFAEPMSFGQKLRGHYCEFKRRFNDLKDFYNNELTGQISGAVGNYTIITPEIEKRVLSQLDLQVESVSTQVIPRDRHAKLTSIISLFGCALERLCIEIRHLQHSDVAEVFEGFKKGQKGSSTMPHKKNPISSENLTGMARMLRSYQQIAMDNTLLWHERDISHSSSERFYLPDMFGILFYSIERMTSTIEDLVVDKEAMLSKVTANFKHLSSFVLHKLIEVSNNTREDLYRVVQSASFESKDRNGFFEYLEKNLDDKSDKELIKSLAGLNDLEIYGAHTKEVFQRC